MKKAITLLINKMRDGLISWQKLRLATLSILHQGVISY